MDREGFRNRMKQYKKAREENPGLKYWEWKRVPKYDEGTGMVGTPSVSIADFTNKIVSLLSEASIKGLKNTIKRRLYDNLDPYNYSNWDLGESAQTRIINSIWKNKRDLLMLYREDEYSNERDDIFAEYLEIPKENRHKIYNLSGVDIKHSVIPSKYKPSKTKNDNVEYKTIDKIRHKDIIESLDYSDNLNFNENATVKNNLSKYFGYYTVGRGLDPKRGEYISVYDLWDINPFYGKFGSDSEYGNWLDKLIHKKVGNEDASLGIGKPIEFYDRVYLDDYYGADSAPNKGDYYGGYLPEITVTPTKYAEGGQVEPDPLEVLERSRPKVAGIPINDAPLENVFSPLDIALGTSYKLAPIINRFLPNYGSSLGALVLGSNDTGQHRKYQSFATKKLDGDVSEFYNDIVIPMNPNNEVYKQHFIKQFGNPTIEIHPTNTMPDNFAADLIQTLIKLELEKTI